MSMPQAKKARVCKIYRRINVWKLSVPFSIMHSDYVRRRSNERRLLSLEPNSNEFYKDNLGMKLESLNLQSDSVQDVGESSFCCS